MEVAQSGESHGWEGGLAPLFLYRSNEMAQHRQGIALKRCAIFLTRCLTLVPTRNSQVYETTVEDSSTRVNQCFRDKTSSRLIGKFINVVDAIQTPTQAAARYKGR